MTDEPTTPTDGDILADPSAFTVEEVTEAFARASDDDVDMAKALEEQGKNRAGIANWERPTSDEPAPDQVVFTRERLLSSEAQAITGVPSWVLVGALHGDDSAEFTREQIDEKVQAFLAREV
jgi:hypothetical protein